MDDREIRALRSNRICGELLQVTGAVGRYVRGKLYRMECRDMRMWIKSEDAAAEDGEVEIVSSCEGPLSGNQNGH
jgi:hypothetical protein